MAIVDRANIDRVDQRQAWGGGSGAFEQGRSLSVLVGGLVDGDAETKRSHERCCKDVERGDHDGSAKSNGYS